MPPSHLATALEQVPDRVRRLVQDDVLEAIVRRILRLERQVAALREARMRRTVVCEAVSVLDSDALVAFLATLLQRVRHGSGRSRAVLQQLALEPTVFRELPRQRVEAATTLARQASLNDVAHFFLDTALKSRSGEESGPPGNQHLDLPLGTRRTAARTTDRFRLDRLLHDRDHRVIRILLNNPRITERDVVRIAAMRPTRPDVLEVVAEHRKWSTRYRVRKALACNPWTPGPVARRLLPTLMRQDLRHVLEAGVLAPELVPEVRQLLRSRDADTAVLDATQASPHNSDRPAATLAPRTPKPPPELPDDDLTI